MVVEVTITEVTKMQRGKVCVAGYHKEHGEWRCVRPQFVANEGIDEARLTLPDGVVTPFSVVACDLEMIPIEPPHVEDRLIKSWSLTGRTLEDAVRQALLQDTAADSVVALFGGDLRITETFRWYVEKGAATASLGTVRIEWARAMLSQKSWPADEGKWRYRLVFRDGSGTTYDVALTDLAARRYLQSVMEQRHLHPAGAAAVMSDGLARANDIFLRLGLTRAYGDWPDRYWLQVNAVHTFPDYLEGRCHADLRGWER